jgi:ABC-type Mn2+/Zn2+ transport system ATPase subunit
VSTIEERVAYIEGQVSEQSHAMVEVREAVRMLEHRVDGRFEAMDWRFEAIDRRFEAVDRRFDTVDRRIDALDEKLSRYFVWLVGLQVTTLVAIVGALLTRA